MTDLFPFAKRPRTPVHAHAQGRPFPCNPQPATLLTAVLGQGGLGFALEMDTDAFLAVIR